MCPTNATVGTPIALSGGLSPALAERTVTLTVSGAASSSLSATTQGNGSYSSTTYVPSTPGQYTIVASYSGETGYSPSKSTPCTVNAAAAPPVGTVLTLGCPPANVNPGSPISLSGALSPPLGGRPITITLTGPSPTGASATTQPDGSYQAMATAPPKPGQYTIVAHYAGEPGYLPSDSPPCSVMVVSPVFF
jgi:hypothetical protein